jgi:hypothetical protein
MDLSKAHFFRFFDILNMNNENSTKYEIASRHVYWDQGKSFNEKSDS